MHAYRKILLLAFAVFLQFSVRGQTVLTVSADQPGAEIQPTMWGIFFEDINFAADGGIYAELVKNRSFEFAAPLMGWKEEKSDRFSLNKQSGSAVPLNRGGEHPGNPRFIRINVNADNAYALINDGFHGMGIKKDLAYDFSILARQVGGNVSIRINIIDDEQRSIGATTVKPDSKDWKKYASELVASSTFSRARLRLGFSGTGVVDLDMVSLFPGDTWKNRKGGLRADLVQLLYDLKPGFLRFPGGCIVEGRDLSQRYQWKKTVGDPDARELLINRWNTEFAHRPAPDYFQSFGLGFFEYFQLAEDIGAEPLPILSCGMACQFNTAELVPLDQMDSYVQDALDLIEFANGPVTSRWGKLRADMGHPDPFHLKMIGVGNEQWGPQYIERYKIFESSIKGKYPDIKIISSAGPFPDGEMFEYASGELKTLKAEIVDEHYYRKPEWFFENTNRYDRYDRQGPKIFAGEYAAQSVNTVSPDNKNNWWCALAEAAFMTGLERNADVVYLTSYAPLFAHAERWQWTPDLIWFDNLRAYGTPNYHVQKLFSNNKGTNVLPIRMGAENVNGQQDLYASAVWDKHTNEMIIKIVNASDKPHSAEILVSGVKRLNSRGTVIEMKSEPGAVNSFDDPSRIVPAERDLSMKGKAVKVELGPRSLSVIKIKTL